MNRRDFMGSVFGLAFAGASATAARREPLSYGEELDEVAEQDEMVGLCNIIDDSQSNYAGAPLHHMDRVMRDAWAHEVGWHMQTRSAFTELQRKLRIPTSKG
uniref:Uncharacterized protein n=1 Tax=viral metagenome TaxID=1070528 RepID=A0A6M3IZ04_9ZZZZ